MVKKIVASIAVVGTIAAVAVINMTGSNNASGTFLASNNDQIVMTKFNDFISKNQKNYLTKEEYKARLNIFKQNYDFVEKNNAQNSDFKLELNKFSDMSDEEYQKRMGFKKIENDFDDDVEDEADTLDEDEPLLTQTSVPASKDWRQEGAVTSIKNQGSCGSCWSFSSSAAMEGAYKIFKNGPLTDLSMQQLMDCSSSYGNAGCGGGLMTNVFNYLKSAKIQPLSTYPYAGRQQTCKYSASQGVVGTTGYTNIAKNSNTALRAAIAKQPVSVAIAAGSSSFRLYKSGIFSASDCGTSLNHAVLAVGYGTQNGQDYFIIKNSWGTSWGEAGYIRILDNGAGSGVCGILQMNSIPNV